MWLVVAITRIPARVGFQLVWPACDSRLTLENLTDTDYLFTQAGAPDPQRLYRNGRTVALSFGYNVF